MPVISVTAVGLPVVVDGHQFRVERPERLVALDDPVLRLVLIEDAAVTVDKPRRIRLDPPVLLLLPPGSGGCRVARGAFCYRIDLDAGPDLLAILGLGQRPWHRSGPEVQRWSADFIRLAQLWWRGLGERRRAAVRLTDLLLEAVSRPAQPRAKSLVERFQDLVDESLGSDLGADDLARRLGVSRSTLDRAISRRLGYSPAAWLRRERLHTAAKLLYHSTRPPNEIGRACGFRDPDSFSRAFTRQHGCTPAAWRRQA